MHRVLSSLVLVGVLALASAGPLPGEVPPRLPSPPGVLVAHALGGIEGVSYTNSPDAFRLNYTLGRRWFEVDLALTRDRDLVCFHVEAEPLIGFDRPVAEVTTADFLGHCYRGAYPLMTFNELLGLVAARPDSFIVTDTKGWDGAKAAALERELRRVPPEVRRRVVPQIYFPQDVPLLEPVEAELGRFPRLIFTLYGYTNIGIPEVLNVMRVSGARIVTVSSQRFSPELASAVHSAGGTVLVHTVNLETQITLLSSLGADGFYTDFFLPGVDPFAGPLLLPALPARTDR